MPLVMEHGARCILERGMNKDERYGYNVVLVNRTKTYVALVYVCITCKCPRDARCHATRVGMRTGTYIPHAGHVTGQCQNDVTGACYSSYT